MKPSKHIVIYFILLITLSLAACAVPAGESAETAQVISSVDITNTPTAEPTTTLEPLPCMIAFDADRDGNREIYVMEPDGSDPTNLSNHPADDWGPVWSPEGSRIAFVSNRENERGASSLYHER